MHQVGSFRRRLADADSELQITQQQLRELREWRREYEANKAAPETDAQATLMVMVRELTALEAHLAAASPRENHLREKSGESWRRQAVPKRTPSLRANLELLL